jgi:hypothetical protein
MVATTSGRTCEDGAPKLFVFQLLVVGLRKQKEEKKDTVEKTSQNSLFSKELFVL